MRKRQLLLAGVVFTLAFVCMFDGIPQAQAVQNRIPQQIIVNGQRGEGVYVTAPGGGLQSYTCSNPQQYVTADGSTQGWACYDQAMGVWMLNALPPAQASVPPAVVYQQPAPVVVQPAPAVVYAAPVYPVVVAPAYPSSVVLGAAAIDAAGRIVSAAVAGSRYSRVYYVDHYRYGVGHVRGRGHWR
jgi:hypothetical protein